MAATSNAFMTSQAPSRQLKMTSLFEGEADAAETVDEPSWPAFEPSGLSVNDVKKTISRMNKDNFNESLTKIESYLVNEAGQTFYNKCVRRVQQQAKDLGTTVPVDYVKQARCNAGRREKQNAFIQAKEEERLAAEAEAAQAAAAEAEAAKAETAEEATAEEPELVEA
eukprot:scaffold1067_cov150-Amphora_coffeaeformis.AAC.1